MSIKPSQIFSISANDTPEQIEMRIKLLVRLYVFQHDKNIATAIIAHINAILAHPKYIQDTETRYQYRCLVGHWRCIAWVYESEDLNYVNKLPTLNVRNFTIRNLMSA